MIDDLRQNSRALKRVLRHPKPAKPLVWKIGIKKTDKLTVSISVRRSDSEDTIIFRSSDVPLVPCSEAAITAVYLSAARVGADLSIDGDVDATFAANLQRISTVLYSWSDDFSPPDIMCNLIEAKPGHSRNRLMPFTGGVDSTYSLLKEPTAPEAFLNVAGFDYPIDAPSRAGVETRLRGLAERAGTKLVVVETDIRKFTDRYVHHTAFNHASIFAAIGHLTKGSFGRLLVPSSHPADMPAGSHFTMDPLWSSPDLEIIHHGEHTARVEKIVYLSKFPEIVDTIKVCSNRKSTSLNCGKCYKCIATMTTFDICGVTSMCGASSDDLSARSVLFTPLTTSRSRRVLIENIRLARFVGHQRMERLLRYNMAIMTSPAPRIFRPIARLFFSARKRLTRTLARF